MTVSATFYNERIEAAERLGTAWRDEAACRGKTDLFYPVSGAGKPAPDYDTPLSICAHCPVLEPCRRWAEAAGEVKDGYTHKDIGHVVAGCRPKAKGTIGRPAGMPVVRTLVGEKVRCKQCRATFTVIGTGQRYCSKECSQAFRTEVKRMRRRAS